MISKRRWTPSASRQPNDSSEELRVSAGWDARQGRRRPLGVATKRPRIRLASNRCDFFFLLGRRSAGADTVGISFFFFFSGGRVAGRRLRLVAVRVPFVLKSFMKDERRSEEEAQPTVWRLLDRSMKARLHVGRLLAHVHLYAGVMGVVLTRPLEILACWAARG